MVDWVKKLNKARSEDFHVGERLLGATFVQPGGNFGAMMGSQLGGVVGTIAANKMAGADDSVDSSAGLAATIAGDNAVIGVTNWRLLVWNHSRLSGKPKDLKAEIPLKKVAGVEAETGKLLTKIALQFEDGSAVAYEAPKIGKPESFVDALEQKTG